MKIRLFCLLLVMFWYATTHSIFAQNPAFVLSSTPSVGSIPECVIAAEVNGDGKVDLISANTYGGTLTVLTNNGSGGFAPASPPNFGLYTYSYSVCAADVNGDGKVDLINADFNNNWLTVLTNDGSGGFVLASVIPVGVHPDSVCAADINGDGKMDLICANYSGVAGTLTVLTNDGHGGFVLSSSPSVSREAQCVIAADVNGDGKVDLVCANLFDSTLTVLTNDGAGGFVLSSSPSYNYGAAYVCAADVNGDGKVDLITADFTYSGDLDKGTLTIFTNDGSGGFEFASSPTVGSQPNSVCAADVNGDGKMDLICANWYGNYANSLTVLTNDGSGNFVIVSTINVGSGPASVCAADVNGDGKADLISANYGDDTLTVLTNATIFPPPTSVPPLTITPSGAQISVSWPSASPGWSLQQNPDLTTANWGPSGYYGYGIADDGTNKSLTLPATSGNLFFRLLHP